MSDPVGWAEFYGVTIPVESDVVDGVDYGQDDEMTGTASVGDALVGRGSIEKVIAVTRAGQPTDGASVWISTDVAGTNVIAGTLHTDAFGRVTFMLDPGTYYVWVQQAGVNFTNPTTITVTI